MEIDFEKLGLKIKKLKKIVAYNNIKINTLN